jgi:putative flippase GtrA
MRVAGLPTLWNLFLTSRLGQRLARYSAVSIILLAFSETLLLLFNGAIGLSAAWSSTLTTVIATVPAYVLNRRWVWSKGGRSHLWKEIVPFWALAFFGWAFATYSVSLAESVAKTHNLHSGARVALVGVTYVLAYGVLWIGKFLIFDRLLFVHRPEHVVAAPRGPDTRPVVNGPGHMADAAGPRWLRPPEPEN